MWQTNWKRSDLKGLDGTSLETLFFFLSVSCMSKFFHRLFWGCSIHFSNHRLGNFLIAVVLWLTSFFLSVQVWIFVGRWSSLVRSATVAIVTSIIISGFAVMQSSYYKPLHLLGFTQSMFGYCCVIVLFKLKEMKWLCYIIWLYTHLMIITHRKITFYNNFKRQNKC